MFSINSLESSIIGPSHRSWTRLSSVVGFSDSQSQAATGSYYLEGIARAVARLKLQRCRPEDFQDSEVVGGGETFKVVKTQYKESLVAVKYVRVHDESDNDIVQRRLRSVLQEIVIMHHQPLASHDNILNILGYGWDISNGVPLPYVVVEYGEGGSLRDWLKGKVSVHYDTKRSIINDVASALDAVHKCQLIHGDMKLDNIIAVIPPDKPNTVVAKIADFGHSIVHTSDDRQKNRYLGTTLYNAPEVQKQKRNPIPPEELFKCDIWSYGLLAWEVLKDGDRFFNPAWATVKDLERKCDDSCTSDTSPTSRTLSATCTLHSVSADVEDVFGNFDVAYLRRLVFITLCNTYFNLIPEERRYLKRLFLETLHADPASRKLDAALQRLSGSEKTTLPEKVTASAPVELGTSEFDIEIFQRAGHEDLIWECQQRILRDFEEASNAPVASQQALDAALRTGLCYLSGFGTSCNYQKAMASFSKAASSSNPIAELFLSRVDNGQQAPRMSSPEATYTRFLINKYRQQHQSRLIRHSGDRNLPVDDKQSSYNNAPSDPGLWNDVPWTFCQNAVENCTDRACTDKELTNNILNAVHQADLPHLELLLQTNTPESFNAWDCHGDTPLLLACKLGNFEMVKLLLERGADPTLRVKGGCSVYHWLFCLGDSLCDLEDLFFGKLRPQDDILNEMCSCRHSLHEQWPLPLGGSPLAFAVTTNSYAAVGMLLKHGADPLLSAYPVPEFDTQSPIATPIHLAIRFCLPRITHLLVQAVHGTLKDSYNCLEFDFNDMFDPPKYSSSTTSNIYKNSLAVAIGFSSLLELYFVHGCETQKSIRETLRALPAEWLLTSNTNGWTTLSAAILGNNAAVVSELLSFLPELAFMVMPDPLDASNTVYPVHLAARRAAQNAAANNSIEILETVMQTDCAALTRKDGHGYNVLQTSVKTSSQAVTRWLITAGADINDANDVSGETPLMLVQSVEILDILLANGADLESRDLAGHSAASHLLLTGRKDMALRLQRTGVDMTKILTATMLVCAKSDDVESMKRLLNSQTMSINERDENGNTPLIVATENGCSNMVAWLLSVGADWFQPNHMKMYALQLAIDQSHTRRNNVLEVYLRHFSEDAPVEHGWIFMCQLAANPCQIAVEVLRCLLFNHKFPAKSSSSNCEPSCFATRKSMTQNMRERIKRGDTPLHIAAHAVNLEAVKLILKSELHVNIPRNDGHTPLMSAYETYKHRIFGQDTGIHSEICFLLLTHEYNYYNSAKTWTIALEKNDFLLVSFIIDRVSTAFLHPPPSEGFVRLAIERGQFDLVVKFCMRGLLRPQGLFLPSLEHTFRQSPWFANVPDEHSPERITWKHEYHTGVIVYDLPNMKQRYSYEIILEIDSLKKSTDNPSLDDIVKFFMRRQRLMTNEELSKPGIASFKHLLPTNLPMAWSWSESQQTDGDGEPSQDSGFSSNIQTTFLKRCIDNLLGKPTENASRKKRKVGDVLTEKMRRAFPAAKQPHITSDVNIKDGISSVLVSLPPNLIPQFDFSKPSFSTETIVDYSQAYAGRKRTGDEPSPASNTYFPIPISSDTTTSHNDEAAEGTSKYYQKLEADGEAELFSRSNQMWNS